MFDVSVDGQGLAAKGFDGGRTQPSTIIGVQ